MKTLTVYPDSINSRAIDDAVRILRDGGIVIYPTDTIYALGCNALDNRAVERLCRLKGINPDKHLLSIVCSSLSQAAEYAKIDNRAFRLLKENLPGPFTFILPAQNSLPKVFKGRKTVGIRIPDHPVALALAEALGAPVASTSVAIDEDESDDARHADSLALRYGHDADLVIDSGEGDIEPSTIVDLLDSSAPEVVRQSSFEIEL